MSRLLTSYGEKGKASLPSREELPDCVVDVLHQGKSRNPDVFLVELDGQRFVVKDFAPRGGFVRHILGPWLINREIRAYEALDRHPSVPHYLGKLDRMAFALEYRPGERMSRSLKGRVRSDFISMLQESIANMHRLGVVHLDLRHRSNVLVGEDGRPVLIDFASAICGKPSSFFGRVVLSNLARIDRWAFDKWRVRLSEGPRPLTIPTSKD